MGRQRRWVGRTISVAPYGGAEQFVIAPFRHLWKFLNDFAVLDDGPKIVHRPRVVGVPERADGEVNLGSDQTQNEDQQAVGTTRRC